MHIPHGTLVMALDGEKMLLFRNEGDEKYAILETLTSDAIANPPSRDQGSDAPGRSFSSTGERRSAYSETDWHRQSEERFALACAERLEALAAGTDDGIVVLAPPRTLGVVRGHWSNAVKDRLIAEIGKDLVHHTTDDIARAIGAHDAPQPAA